jgi:hypothetical protein
VNRSLIPLSALALIVGCSESGSGGGQATNPTPTGSDPASTTTTTVAENPSTDTTGDATTPALPTEPPTMTFALAAQGLPETGMWKCDPVFEDVNKDGHMDLAAIPRLGDGPHVYLGNGKGEWVDSSLGLKRESESCGGGLCFGDANNDGHLDLLVADHCSGVFVYLGDGTGQKWEKVVHGLYPADLQPTDGRAPMYMGAEDITAGDMNSDGNLDLIAGASDEGGINLYLGDGTGRNWTRKVSGLPESGWATRLEAVDMNNDGHLDVVASYDEGPRVWINSKDATFQWGSTGLPTPSIRGIYTGLGIGDVNEDGRLDVCAANWIDGPEVYLQDADGYWTKTPDAFPAMVGGAIGLEVGDIDGDGHLDMVTSGRLKLEAGVVRGVFALKGNGKGQWLYQNGSGLPDTGLLATPGVTIGDMDADGVLDVAACSGLLVETGPGLSQPTIGPRVMVWRTTVVSPRAASSVGQEDDYRR